MEMEAVEVEEDCEDEDEYEEKEDPITGEVTKEKTKMSKEEWEAEVVKIGYKIDKNRKRERQRQIDREARIVTDAQDMFIKDKDVKDVLPAPPDKGGIFRLVPDPKGTIFEDPNIPGRYTDQTHPYRTEVFRTFVDQPCPFPPCDAANVSLDATHCYKCKGDLRCKSEGTFVTPMGEPWHCKDENLCDIGKGVLNNSESVKCRRCGCPRPWTCNSCGRTELKADVCQKTECKKGMRPLTEAEVYDDHLNHKRSVRVRYSTQD